MSRRKIWSNEFKKKWKEIDVEFWGICNEFYLKGGRLDVSNYLELNNVFRYMKLAVDSFDLGSFISFLERRYYGSKVRGNLRFFSFVFKQEHIDGFVQVEKDKLLLKEILDLYRVYEDVKEEVGIYIGVKEDWSLGKGKEQKEKREKLYRSFIQYREDRRVDLKTYFRWFFEVFISDCSKKDSGVSPGFWFSLSVFSNYEVYSKHRRGRRAGIVDKYY